ncbi:hypothetical protein N7462_009754 [Penicillium macrosclerotiorum]|uniref:uncharacterized protein n=1 Tax=Penicillium macrosclerotiorum TaxID=303699 RepID=UPI002549B542|nr:uncharacterized protein N7462_009754 [Penicillium macrosclerotiorum]KAJ5668684.1 hypothetical protein N7462_009754 [Penicillium macrosclerotiorum]
MFGSAGPCEAECREEQKTRVVPQIRRFSVQLPEPSRNDLSRGQMPILGDDLDLEDPLMLEYAEMEDSRGKQL